jgi:tetratricopeptide (TPR) repeat protein
VVRRDLTGQWVLGMPDHAALGKVHDLLWERIARCHGGLVDDDKLDAVVRVVAVGALEGRQFTAQAVALVVGRDADELIDELDEHLLAGPQRPDGLLEEAGFVALADPRATTDGEGEGRWVSRYRFVSELHWRTLRRYGLPGRERHDGCRALAAALERVLQPEPERAAAQIASLLREAGDHQAAAAWQIQAEFGAAVPVVEASARLLLAQDTSGWDRFDHAQAARQLGHATFLLWHHRPVGMVLGVAEGWARTAQAANWPAQHARALHHCGLLHQLRGEPDPAIGYLRQARREAAAAGDPGFAAHAMAERARTELHQGQMRVARRRAEAARQLAHRHHAPRSEAAALGVLADLALRAGDGEGALAAATAGAVAAERSGDRMLLVLLLEYLSGAQQELGRVEQARETAARALDMARQTGDRVHEGSIESRLGRLWAADPPVAEGHLLRGLAIARQLDDHEVQTHCRVLLAELAGVRGQLRGAQAELVQARPGSPPPSAPRTWRRCGRDGGGWPRRRACQAGRQRCCGRWPPCTASGPAARSRPASGRRPSARRPRRASRAGEQGWPRGLKLHSRTTGGWGLLHEIFGPFDTNDPSGGEGAPGA